MRAIKPRRAIFGKNKTLVMSGNFLLVNVLLGLAWIVLVGQAVYFSRKWNAAKDVPMPTFDEPADCITVVRRKDPAGFARKLVVSIDRKRAGKVATGEALNFRVEPGRHIGDVRMDWCRSQALEVEKSEGIGVTVWCGARYNDWRCLPMVFLCPNKYFVVEMRNVS